MDVQPITVDRDEALRLVRKYKEHRHYSTPVDAEILRISTAVAKGKLIIPALAEIVRAGLGPDRLPKLAIARGDAKLVWLTAPNNGACMMISDWRWVQGNTARTRYASFAAGSFPGIDWRSDHKAAVPLIPPDIRPKRGLQNYHVLFEAVWRPEPPVDPLLIRRIGAGDVWVVVAEWELTPIERAVLAAHMGRH